MFNSSIKKKWIGSERYQHLVSKAVDRGLRVFGYYESSVRFERKKTPRETRFIDRTCHTWNPTKLAGTDVQIEGEAAQDENFTALRKNLPKEGELVEHQTYDDYKTSISRLALGRGYFDGEFKISRLEISPETYQAWWRILFDSGVRYHYGNITFNHSQIREDYLNNILNIKSGEPYLTAKLSELTNDFSSSNWFSSVLVQPNVNHKTKTVDVDIILYPRKKKCNGTGRRIFYRWRYTYSNWLDKTLD